MATRRRNRKNKSKRIKKLRGGDIMTEDVYNQIDLELKRLGNYKKNKEILNKFKSMTKAKFIIYSMNLLNYLRTHENFSKGKYTTLNIELDYALYDVLQDFDKLQFESKNQNPNYKGDPYRDKYLRAAYTPGQQFEFNRSAGAMFSDEPVKFILMIIRIQLVKDLEESGKLIPNTSFENREMGTGDYAAY